MLHKPGQFRRCLDHLLQVVEKEEHLPLADVLGQTVPRAERVRDRLRDERVIPKGCEGYPRDAVSE